MKLTPSRPGHTARTALATTVLALCILPLAARAQFEITTGTGSTAENFDSLSNTGTTGAFLNDTIAIPGTLDGWSLFSATNTALTSYRIGTGSGNAGGIYSFGGSGAPERALGGIGSGSFSGYIAFAALNSSASTLTSFTLGFDGEQWRNGGATAPAFSSAQTMTLEYGFGTDFATVSSWTAPGANFNWTSPVFGDAAGATTGAAVDGNVAGLVAGRGGTANGLIWNPGDTLWIRWIELNDAGNDHGLAIDNVTFSWVAGALPKNLVWTPTSNDWNTSTTNWKDTSNDNTVAFGTGDSVTFDDGGLTNNNVVIPAGGVSPGGMTVANTSGTYTFSGGPIAAGSALQKQGGGTLVLGAAYAGGLNASGGLVRTTAAEVLGNGGTVSLADGVTLDLNGNDETVGALNLTGATITSGAGLLTIGGNVTLTASPTDTPTTISGRLSNGGGVRKFAVADSLAPEDLILSASLTGAGRVDFDGAGTVRIAGDNSTFSGGLQFDSGLTYVLANSNALGTGQLFLNGGGVEGAVPLTGVNKLSAPVSLGGVGATFSGQSIEFGGALTFFGTGTKSYSIPDGMTVTFSGTLTSPTTGTTSSAITKAGPGTLVLSENGAAYTGIVSILNGTVVAASDSALGTGAVILAPSAPETATLAVITSTTMGALISGGADETSIVTLGQASPSVDPVVLTISTASDAIYGGTIETVAGRTAVVTKAGLGTQTLSGPQSYSALNVTDGILNLNHALIAPVGKPTVNVTPTAATATLNIGASQTLAALNIGAGGVVVLEAPVPVFGLGPDGSDELFAGAANGALVATPVPEPTSVGLLLAGALGFLGRRRRAGVRAA